MSEKKKKERNVANLLAYDSTVEEPQDIIDSDKDLKRKEAFQETYKRIANIIPEYFMTRRKKRKNSTSGGTSFSQNIVVTPEKTTVEIKETTVETKEETQKEEKERE